MQTLDAALHSDDVNAMGTVTLIRVTRLAELNKNFGRKAIDGLLASVGSTLNDIVAQHSRWTASRLNGSDYAVLAPRALEADAVAREAQDGLSEVLDRYSI